jgi:putative acetyltransferase
MNLIQASGRYRNDIKGIYQAAFPETESEPVAKVADDLLQQEDNPEIISVIAEINGTVAGHIAFSPVSTDNDTDFKGYILAPLAVKPEFQNRGVGASLIRHGLQLLSQTDSDIVFVYGDPDYYGKFGFNADIAAGFIPPYKLEYPFAWQALVLNDQHNQKVPVKISCVKALSDATLW